MSRETSRRSRLGRPPSESAESHAVIMDAVYELLQEMPARDLTMEAVAKRAKVGKPTLYKWWPSKAALILAMFSERVVVDPKPLATDTAEEALRLRIQIMLRQFNGFFGKVMADLVTEAQSDATVLRDLYEHHISLRRAAAIADVERGKANGEFRPDTDSEALMDALGGAVYFRLLLRSGPLTEAYGEELLDQLLRGARP